VLPDADSSAVEPSAADCAEGAPVDPPTPTRSSSTAEPGGQEDDIETDPMVVTDLPVLPDADSSALEPSAADCAVGAPVDPPTPTRSSSTAELDEPDMSLQMSVDEIDASREDDVRYEVTQPASQTGTVGNTVSSDTDAGGYYNQEEHKDEVAPSSVQKRRVRRKVRCEAEWKKNVRKRLKNSGKSYVSSSGKIIAAKQMGDGCTDKCRYKCKANFDEEDRKVIFNNFWEIGDINHQRQFIADHVGRTVTARPQKDISDSRRQLSYRYQMSNNNTKYTVCKVFFLDTLGIKEDVVYGAFAKKCSSGVVETDRRGKHNKHRAVSKEDKKLIRQHIASFQTVESHYCRKSSDRKYLPAELSVTKMHRMYKEMCATKGVHAQKEAVYRRIFNRKFNLHFFVPKKDQCDLCTEYRNTAGKSPALESKYRQHCDQKNLARQAKQTAKEAAAADQTCMAICFDLQKVLNCPHGETSSYYYHRKLSLYNLSVYSLGTRHAYCYLWQTWKWKKSQAKRGCNEIASCLLKFVRSQVSVQQKHLTFFSDNCGGQ